MNQSDRRDIAEQYARGELDDEQYEQEMARLTESAEDGE